MMRKLMLACSLTAVLCSAALAAPAQAPAAVKSWLYVDPSCASRVLVSGEQWKVTVEYYLDPSEDDDGTKINIWGAGPWIDCPDGKYEKERHHVSLPGLFDSIPVKAGSGAVTATFTVPPALPHNGILLIVNYVNAGGQAASWQVRRGGTYYVRKNGYFELETAVPGNLFTYDQPVQVITRLKNVKEAGAQKTLNYKVYDTTGAVAAQGSVPFTVQKDGQQVPIDLKLQRRGTFWIEAEVPGWEKRETTFARIPDLAAVTGGKPTQFGSTNIAWEGPPERVKEVCEISKRLGLTSARLMESWYGMEPGPGVYKLDAWQKALQMAREAGISPWICIYDPPAWANTAENKSPNYSSVRVNWDAWRDYVSTATRQFKGSIIGWEWLNEITPGGTPDPVGDYVTLCRIGTQTAKAIEPDLLTLLAGGLWPRSYRLEMLRAGVGQYIDVLPIHYSNGSGVREAREDLDNAGWPKVQVWDDETSRGRNDWGVPPMEELTNTEQARWVLGQWPDELAAGSQGEIFFGGEPDPAGNWSYLLDDLRPRPVAATLAVLTSKMFGARPLGTFTLGQDGLFHLFERGGKALLVCTTRGKGATVPLHVGVDKVRVTDYQGNETMLDAPSGLAPVKLGDLSTFLEDADLDVLKAYVAPQVEASRAAAGRTPPDQQARVGMLIGKPGEVAVTVRNLYDRPLAGSVSLSLPAGWQQPQAAAFNVPAGQQALVAVPVTPPAEAKDYSAEAAVRFDWDKLPEVRKPFVISVISAQMLGNMIKDSGFEQPDKAGTGPADWSVNGKTSLWTDSKGLGLGLGKRVVEFTNSPDYIGVGQGLNLRGGQTYLYTAWVWNRDMDAGSNIYQTMSDGSTRALFDVQVFKCGQNNSYWQVYTCRYKAPEGLAAASFGPLAIGKGTTYLDNVSVSTFEGSDFAAECRKTSTAPVIDGDLKDWSSDAPIPLIGRNQLTVSQNDYKWTPQNLNGVAYLRYDDANLYLALQVMDDRHTALPGEQAPKGDGFILAVDPTGRGQNAAQKAFELYVSDAAPGAGGGKHTIFRPEEHSGGLRTGHLFRDSSVYELAVKPTADGMVYEMRIPWSEMGGVQPGLGMRFGLSLQLDDNDGAGPAAHMSWGGGISPNWQPTEFGVATCTE
jgi:hypothetical protein